jgi:diacylglycerol kinase (ATP)
MIRFLSVSPVFATLIPRMRAAAIFGPGSSEKDLKPFQKESNVTWLVGMPTDSKQADAILIFGGDGTIHRHLEKLVKLQLPVLIVPRGSGNDFARALNLKRIRHAITAWKKFASNAPNVRTIDLGVITPGADSAGPAGAGESKPETQSSLPRNQKYFCCIAGIGLDVEIARRANKLPRWVRAHGGYALTLPQALCHFAPFPMKISIPDTAQPHGFVERTVKPTLLAAFANAPSYGGGMKIAPQAKLDDGQLDICLITDIDKFKLFCLFPTVYFGRHLGIPEVEYCQAPALRVETEHPLDVYADGEYVCQTPIELHVAREVLRVIVP